MKKIIFITCNLFLGIFNTTGLSAQKINPFKPDFTKPKTIPGMTLVWNDEFNRKGKPDTTSWKYEEGFVRNEELQWYTKQNAYCNKGVLVLEGRKEKFKNPNYVADSKDWKLNREFADYTSSSIQTKGLRQFQFGRFEFRAKVDTSSGEWIDLWTMGINDPWPFRGEIDIAEYKGGKVHDLRANVIWSGNMYNGMSLHSERKTLAELLAIDPEWPSKFHIWRMDWDSTEIKIYLDDVLMNTTQISKAANPNGTNGFLQPHYILLTNALGQYGGDPSNSKFPIKLKIDYIRVYQISK